MTPRYSHNILPNFIVVEGLDGAGTSTQSQLLEKRLVAEGFRVQLSAEPTPGPVGTLIRQIMRGRLIVSEDRRATERLLAHLFAADRHDHLYNTTDGVAPAIADGCVAISTRYFFSSFAYNGSTPEEFDLIERLNRDFPLPEILVYLHVPVEVSLERLDEREVREFYEREDELRRVRASYERVLAPLGDRVIRVDSTQPRDETARLIGDAVVERLRH